MFQSGRKCKFLLKKKRIINLEVILICFDLIKFKINF